MIVVALKGLWVTLLYTRDAGLNAFFDAAVHYAGGLMSYYTIPVTPTKMWTSLHRLVLWAARCHSSPPRLLDSQCRGKKWIKAFLLKYILIAGVNDLHNKSQIILITLCCSFCKPLHFKNIVSSQTVSSQS